MVMVMDGPARGLGSNTAVSLSRRPFSETLGCRLKVRFQVHARTYFHEASDE
jgi:hypothetical protein